MSTQRASYQISPAEQARLAEEARQQELARQWEAARVVRAQQRDRAVRIGRLYDVAAPAVQMLGSLTATDSTVMDRELRDAFAETARWATELDRAELAGQDAVVARRVTAIVGAVTAERREQVEVGTRATAGQTADRYLDRDAAEAARIVARLDCDLARSDHLDARVEVIGQTDERARPVLLDALRAEVRRLNTSAERRRSDAAALAYLRTAAEQTGDPALAELMRAADRAFTAGEPVELERLRMTAETTLRDQQRERERRFVEQTVVAAFVGLHAELPYEVITGFEVGTPTHGVLLRRAPGSQHAVELEVDGDGISVKPVRLAPAGVDAPRNAEEREAERAAERAVCADATELWSALRQRNVDLSGRVVRADGLMPRCIPVRPELIDTERPDTAADDEDQRTSRKRRPHTREQDL